MLVVTLRAMGIALGFYGAFNLMGDLRASEVSAVSVVLDILVILVGALNVYGAILVLRRNMKKRRRR